MFEGLRARFEDARFRSLHRQSRSAIERWQAEKLRKLIEHIATAVPFYKQWYGDASVSASSIRTIADLARLPVLKKEMFLNKAVEEYIDNTRPASGAWRTTSGTSGKPLTVLGSDLSSEQYFTDFLNFRFVHWREGFLKDISMMRTASIKVRSVPHPNRLFIPIAQWMTEPDRVFEALARFDPEILTSYSSILIELSHYIRSQKPSLTLSPRYAVSFGEALSPLSRVFVSETLGCEVYNRYGIEEIGSIAMECHLHDGMHINSESVIVEIVDESYEACAPGVYGRIIATDLYNYTMPFIRYDTGDHGRLIIEPCACGLKTPRLFIGGRYSASLRFDQRTVHHLEFDAAMDIFMNAVFQYQIVKTAEDSLRVVIIPGPAFSAEVATDISERIQMLVGADVSIKIEQVAIIKPTARGKSRIVVDESCVP